MVTKSMPTTFEKIELALSISTFIAVVAGGVWAIYQYYLSGANEWTNNITLETKVLPYHDNLRLLVIHVKSKNPRNYEFTLNGKLGDTFELRIRKVASNAKENTVFDEEDGELISKFDMMKSVNYEEYQLLPNAETDDMSMIVLPVNTIVSISAEMNIHNGTIDKKGKPDSDYNIASTVVSINP